MRKMIKELTTLPHTQDAYDCVKSRLESGTKKTCYIAATGVGKFYLALLVMRDNNGKNILFVTSYKANKQESNAKAGKYFENVSDISFELYSNLHKYTEQKYDIIILDEFHRAGAKTWNEYVLTLLGNNPDAIVIGTTATPVRYLEDNRNMAEELFDGDIAKEINLKDAILMDILPYPEYYTCGYKFEQMVYDAEQKLLNGKLKKDDKYLKELLKKLKNKVQKAGGIREFFDKYLTERTGHYIVFCKNREHLKEVQSNLSDWFVDTELSVYVVHSASEEDDSSDIIKAFVNDKSEKLHLLLCIDMMNEGYHIEDLSGVIMMRSTESMNVYLQQIGRAFSASGTKIPKIYDLVDNAALLKPIRGFWKELSEEYKKTHPGIGDTHGNADEIYRFHIEKKDLELLVDLENFYDHLYMSWDDWYKLAEEFYKEHGDLNISIDYSIDGYRLGVWISNQRRAYKTGILPIEKIQSLESMGMKWDLSDAQWVEKYHHAENYYKEHGNLLVPMEYSVDGCNLGSWVVNQRRAYVTGVLSLEKIQALESIGMSWSLHDTRWLKNYHHAENYYKEYGNLLVPLKHSIDGCNLGSWIGTQRRAYKDGNLSDEEICLLEVIGMDWDPKETQWQKNYRLAKDYYNEHGDLHIPYVFTIDGCNLGTWIVSQRGDYKKGELSVCKIQLLESIGMVWDVDEARRQEGFVYAKKYYKKYGNLNIHRDCFFDGYKLGQWMILQRRAYNKGNLSAEYIKKLEALGIDWEPKKTQWQKNYGLAKNYYNEHGDLQVPQKYVVDGCNIGKWLSHQRDSYKNGKLSADRIEKLEAIGMVWEVK